MSTAATMTPDEYTALLKRCELRQADVGWIVGVHVRHARSWALGEYPIPRYAELLLRAYDQKKINDAWLHKHIPDLLPA